jgi:hypothetical protein
MGKRELLLAAVFLVLGFVVYQVTAPPGDPSKPGFSFSRILNNVRREVRGQREFAEDTKLTRIPVPGTVREIRLDELLSTGVTVIGEDREDIEAEFHVRSNGYDQAEAKQLVGETNLKSDEAGALLILATKYPGPGRQTGRLTLKIPSRLGVRTDGKSGVMKISKVDSIAIGTARGNTELSDIKGHVAVTQRGSQITVQNVGSVRLQSFSAEVKLSNVRGDTTLNVQGGEFAAEQLHGALEVESRNSEMRFERLEKLRGPVRVNASLGEILVAGLAVEARIDGRETQIRVEPAVPVTLGIYNTEEDVDIVLPPGGMRLDLMATEGDVEFPDSLKEQRLTVTPPPGDAAPPIGRAEKRVTGDLFGGGPVVTVRVTRGEIILKTR